MPVKQMVSLDQKQQNSSDQIIVIYPIWGLQYQDQESWEVVWSNI